MKKNQNGFGPVVVIGVVVIAALIGTAGWVFYSQQKKNVQKDVVQQSDSFSQIQKTEADIKAKSSVVAFSPEDLFSVDEKTKLDKMLIQPNIDYAKQYNDKSSYDPITSITVTKYTDTEYAAQTDYAKFRYSVKVVSKNGAVTDFLFGEKDVIDWWLPECFDGKCGLTDTFKTKYPEIISKLTANGNTP